MLCLRTFCPSGRFVPPDVLFLRMFCPYGRFVSMDVLSLRAFCPTDFMSPAVLSPDVLSPDVLSLQTFCLRTFCLATSWKSLCGMQGSCLFLSDVQGDCWTLSGEILLISICCILLTVSGMQGSCRNRSGGRNPHDFYPVYSAESCWPLQYLLCRDPADLYSIWCAGILLTSTVSGVQGSCWPLQYLVCRNPADLNSIWCAGILLTYTVSGVQESCWLLQYLVCSDPAYLHMMCRDPADIDLVCRDSADLYLVYRDLAEPAGGDHCEAPRPPAVLYCQPPAAKPLLLQPHHLLPGWVIPRFKVPVSWVAG